MFIVCRDKAFQYFHEIMIVIGNALGAATILPSDTVDPEEAEYFERLREHIVECLTCALLCLKDLGKQSEYNNYVKPSIEFIQKINQEEYYPTLVMIKIIIFRTL